jgi:plastocyanin
VTRALAALLALALVAAAPSALARPKTLKQRCAKKGYAKHHRRQCTKHRGKPRQNQLQTTVTPVPAPTPPATGTPAPGSSAAPAAPTGATTRIGVVAREFSLTLSRTTVSAGSASVQLQNFGEDPHDLRVARVDGTGSATDLPSTGPGSRQSQTLTLTPGAYKLYCTLPGHDAAGMHATLTVG